MRPITLTDNDQDQGGTVLHTYRTIPQGATRHLAQNHVTNFGEALPLKLINKSCIATNFRLINWY